MLYRGQCYGESVGTWWTNSRKDAVSFAMSSGGRSWIVFALDENVGSPWAKRFLRFVHKHKWYNIPLDELAKRWRSVRIVEGSVEVEVSCDGKNQ